jgi:hypothetical protein
MRFRYCSNAVQQLSAATNENKMPKYITLERWADATFGADAPSIETIRRWVRNSWIWPRPVKIGRRYFVEPDAEYMDPANPNPRLVQRVMRATYGPEEARGPKRLRHGLSGIVTIDREED